MALYVVVLRISMMPSCPYFILSTPLSLNMWTYLSLSASAWGQARSKLGGVDTPSWETPLSLHVKVLQPMIHGNALSVELIGTD